MNQKQDQSFCTYYNRKPLWKSLCKYVRRVFVQSVKTVCNKFPTNIICTKILVTYANKTVMRGKYSSW